MRLYIYLSGLISALNDIRVVCIKFDHKLAITLHQKNGIKIKWLTKVSYNICVQWRKYSVLRCWRSLHAVSSFACKGVLMLNNQQRHSVVISFGATCRKLLIGLATKKATGWGRRCDLCTCQYFQNVLRRMGSF
jgi:hypothetical protein